MPPEAMPVIFLNGEGIYLRPLDMADVRIYQRWINDANTRVNLASYWPLDEASERRYVESASEARDHLHLVIVLREGDRPIGIVGLRNIEWKNRSADFGIMIGETECRGRGHGSEATRMMLQYAFETLNMHRVQLGVFDFNKAGIRAYEKIGFVREGVQREHSFVDGRYVDHIMYAMLSDEYFSLIGRRRRG